MKLIVDTNIVFSGILNSSNKIGKILLHPGKHFRFYSCEFLRTELQNHKNKLLKLTKLSENELDELEMLVTSRIAFINEELIPPEIISASEILVADIDPDDSTFVALSKHLKAKLWTGDKALYSGLKRKGFKEVINTAELSEILDKLENEF